MAQTQYLSNSRSAGAAAAARPANLAKLASYVFFTVSFCFTAALVLGLVH